MERAIELSKRGRGKVSPNPLVGCVIVKDGDKELHVGKFNSIKTDDMETKFKKEIDEAK